jgi:purine-binding chemotaxis protein CheW
MNTPPNAAALAQQPWLAFELDGQHYAAPLSHVSEVIRDQPPTPVPGAAADMLGICQLRGRVVPVMDGRRRLGLRAALEQADDAARIVVFSHEGHRVGLRVDAVGELLHPQAQAIEPPPPGRAVRDDDPVEAVLAWQGGFIALLDVLRLCRLGTELHRVA